MKAFDNSAWEQYKEEAREKWGQTNAYQQYETKTKHYSRQNFDDLAAEMDAIFLEFSLCMNRGDTPASIEVQQLVQQLQKHITQNYYNCTNQILAGLGQMYVADDRFRQNIDRHADGTATFVCEAIGIYCRT